MPRAINAIVTNYIHEGKQLDEKSGSMILTVGRIGTLVGRGSLDFGGGEFAPSPTAWQEPVKASPDDKYGWWHLEPGSYLLEFNESILLEDGERAVLQIWEQVARTGVAHPTELIVASREPLATVMQVGTPGVDIKENARISRVLLLE
ncbi:MAG: hypothetical protein ACLFPW_00330 [Spirochaetaceae bacterium]